MRRVRGLKQNKIPNVFRVFLMVLAIIIFICVAFFATWNINTIHVKGSNHYSDDVLIDKIVKTKFDHNTILLYLKNKYLKQESIPFIERVDVEIAGKNAVNLIVYEKTIIGCVEYMGQYMYFDKDGIVVESSNKRVKNIPYISGLEFDKIILHEKLEISDNKLYSTILELTQLINKFELNIDKVSFNLEQEVTLYAKKVKVLLGKGKSYDKQLSALKDILPLSKNLSGTINLKNYKPGDDIIFEKDK
ncbi:cell division protein FtsQ/DivIB [Anaeromicropila herbilytica]|uniref:Cell division protein FtsQ n=1 Tax=Anaeromicropila herbilytica TaxID=2785025 RepID=A0A7R7EMZ8_9FIRM|nr:cell division protein FtsQ/DivIB [Anaeromicropila herbilytica]BCN31550.1 hypothetical protein bsdtb5_28450 [Anaeromicropila herbilytica]